MASLKVQRVRQHGDVFGIDYGDGARVSIIEAMAAGCPVVATSVGGIPDLITHGETGWLVGSGDEAALTQAILDTLADQNEAQRRAARARDRALQGRPPRPGRRIPVWQSPVHPGLA